MPRVLLVRRFRELCEKSPQCAGRDRSLEVASSCPLMRDSARKRISDSRSSRKIKNRTRMTRETGARQQSDPNGTRKAASETGPIPRYFNRTFIRVSHAEKKSHAPLP